MLDYNPELVGQLTELGLGQQEAIDCLRASNNDVDKAADLYFSGGLAEWQRNNTWDEGAFHRDRYDEPLEPLTGWGPQNMNVNNPSRTSTRSAEFSHLSLPMMRYLEMQDSSRMGTPSDIGGEDHQHLLGGGFGDDDNMFGHDSERATAYSSSHSNVDYSIQGPDVLTPEVLGGPPRTRPSSPMNPGLDADTNRSDADIARAIHMSINNTYNHDDYSGWGNQETGITGTHSTPTAPTFGPATRPDYDPSQWALTTIPVAHEIYLDPAHPSDRQRKEGEPAFFKPSSDGFHLGPALAIFHSIPAAREALLASQHAIENYGYNERWWSGEKIEGPRITNIIDSEGTEEMVAELEPSEVVLEVQRLMAFLDRTIRGYGSVDSLAKMPEVYEQLQGGQIASFFRKWSADIKELSNLEGAGEPKPFTSTAIPSDPFHKKDFQVLTVHVTNELVNTPGSTLYNAIDQVFWTDQEEATGDVYLDPIADVFCITITRDPSELHGIGLDIPADLYLDRYTAQFVDVVREMKSERENISNEIRGLEKREERLLHCRNSNVVVNTPTVETTKLLDAAIEHFEHLELPSNVPSNEDKDEGGDVTMDTQEQKPKDFFFMSTQLKGMLDRLKVRLEELAGAKEKAKKTLHELTTAFTSPETTPEAAPPLRKHSLRGVFIDLSTTFIKVQRETEERATTDEWWCLSYPLQWEANANTAAYKVMNASEREVLDAAKYTGDGKVLLVYATEEAMQPRESDGKLPEALKTFVEQDNAGFLQELESAGDKGKRKRSNWWDNNTNNNTSAPRISVEDHSSMIDGDGTGVHQPPASPTGFIDATGSPVPSSSGPPQKKSPTGEWLALGAQEEFTGEAPEGHGSPRTVDRNIAWGGGETTGRGWERMDEGSQMQSDGDGGERRYDGNFVATQFTAHMPEEMGFARIGEDEDEEMRDAQHVEYMVGNGEGRGSGSDGAAGEAAWRVFMDESKTK